MLNNKTALRIISLIIAVLLWIYVMGEIDPETKSKIGNIQISFTNTDVLSERGLAVVQDEPILVSATIEGKRSDVNDAKKTGITATVDVSACEAGKNRGEVVISLPDGIRLDSLSEESVAFHVEERVTEEKTVTVEFADNGVGETIPWVLSFDPQTVWVSGAKSSVAQVSVVQGLLEEGKATMQESSVEAALIPVDSEGNEVPGIDLSVEDAYAVVQRLSTKTVALKVEEENLADNRELEKMDVPGSVKIVGTEETLDAVEQIEGTVNLKGITSTGKVEVELQLPEGVYLYDQEKVPVAEITVKTTK